MAPRAPGDSVRPRRLSGASARPLNFTVRRRMRALSQVVLGIVAGVAFAWAVSSIDPYPNRYDLPIFLAALFAFLVVFAILPSPDKRRWYAFGFVTFLCWLVPFFWFWFGAERHGWWYPPHPHILKHFTLIGGESGLDAEVTDVFLLLWAMTGAAFGIRRLTIVGGGRDA